MGLGLTAVTSQARPFLLLDGFMHVPEVGAASPFGMGLVLVVAVVRKTAYPILFLDGFMHVPEVGAASPFGMGLVLVVAVLRQTRSFPALLLDGFMHVPEVSAASPFGMALVLGVLVDSHRPRPSPKAVRQPSSATDPNGPFETILPAGRPPAITLLG
jgi:hypothetical protein